MLSSNMITIVVNFVRQNFWSIWYKCYQYYGF